MFYSMLDNRRVGNFSCFILGLPYDAGRKAGEGISK